MTGYDQKLDSKFFFEHTVQLPLYRLARARYANLSGVGAAAQPGRWNGAGQEALYTSTDPATTLLERLVHTPKNVVPSDLAMLTVHVTGDWIDYGGREFLTSFRTGWSIAVFDTIRDAQLYMGESSDRGVWHGRELFGIAVPSVIVPAWNVILYPKSEGFQEHVRLANVEPFDFDPRLFPEAVTKKP